TGWPQRIAAIVAAVEPGADQASAPVEPVLPGHRVRPPPAQRESGKARSTQGVTPSPVTCATPLGAIPERQVFATGYAASCRFIRRQDHEICYEGCSCIRNADKRRSIICSKRRDSEDCLA